jgi:hypothetical protein
MVNGVYRVEPAVSSRAKCQACKELIAAGGRPAVRQGSSRQLGKQRLRAQGRGQPAAAPPPPPPPAACRHAETGSSGGGARVCSVVEVEALVSEGGSGEPRKCCMPVPAPPAVGCTQRNSPRLLGVCRSILQWVLTFTFKRPSLQPALMARSLCQHCTGNLHWMLPTDAPRCPAG